jgi:adenosylhomocysteine nucleosidase
MVFRSFVRSWLHNTAKEKLREKVLDAARGKPGDEQGPGESGDSDQTRRLVCDVAVVFALGIEAGGLRDLLRDDLAVRGHGFVARYGELAGLRVVLIESGPGQQAAAQATEAVITAHRPGWVIAAGFAGGLTAEVQRYHIVMADSVVDTKGNRLAIDLKVDPASLEKSPNVHVGRLLTADRIIRRPEEKRNLGEKHQALAVDMETAAVAEVCRRQHVRFLAVRVISDSVDETLPEDVERMLGQQTGAAKMGAVVGTLWRRPGSFKDMFRLKEQAITASDRLGKYLASTVNQLDAASR